jgi:hypothetical protein
VRQMQPKMGDWRRFCHAVWHSSLGNKSRG